MTYFSDFELETTGQLPVGWADSNAFWVVRAGVGPDGSKGFGAASAVDDRRTTYTTNADLDCATQYDCQLNVNSSGVGAFAFPMLRSDSAGGNAYIMGIVCAGSGAPNYRFWRRVGGGYNLITQFLSGPTFAIGTWVTVKFEVEGTTTPALRFKIWQQGTAEPGSWTHTTTDGTSQFTSAGRAGLVSGSMGASVSGSLVVDNLHIGPAGSTFVTLAVLPDTASLDVGETEQLAATGFTGDDVTWTSDAPTVATVSAGGLVTAQPHHQGTSQTATITATGVAVPSQTETCVVTVAPVVVTVTPSPALVGLGGTQQFAAAVTGAANSSVTYSVIGGGSITSGGLYTAPAVPTDGITVIATSVADTQQTDTADVTVDGLAMWVTTVPFGATYAGLSTVGFTLINLDGTTYLPRATASVQTVGGGAYFAGVSVQVGWYGVAKWDTGTAVPEIGLDSRAPTPLVTPAETPGRPESLEGMVLRLFELAWPASKKTRNRTTGAVTLYAADGVTELDSQVQSTAGVVDTIEAN